MCGTLQSLILLSALRRCNGKSVVGSLAECPHQAMLAGSFTLSLQPQTCGQRFVLSKGHSIMGMVPQQSGVRTAHCLAVFLYLGIRPLLMAFLNMYSHCISSDPQLNTAMVLMSPWEETQSYKRYNRDSRSRRWSFFLQAEGQLNLTGAGKRKTWSFLDALTRYSVPLSCRTKRENNLQYEATKVKALCYYNHGAHTKMSLLKSYILATCICPLQ